MAPISNQATEETSSSDQLKGVASDRTLERLSAQLQNLESINERLRYELRQSTPTSDNGRESEQGSIRSASSDIETPPGLTTSACSTPLSGDDISTPLDASRTAAYFPAIAGHGKARGPRLSSPLVRQTPESSNSDLPWLGSTAALPIDNTDCRQRISIGHASSGLGEVEPQPSESNHRLAIQDATSTSKSFRESRPDPLPGIPATENLPAQARQSSRPRPVSLSVVDTGVGNLATRSRRSSFPDIFDRAILGAWFRSTQHQQKDLVLPSRPRPVRPGQAPEDEILPDTSASHDDVLAETSTPAEKLASPSTSQASKDSVWSKVAASYTATYCPSEAPPLILPTAPNDAEKELYLKTNRIGLYSFGVFSFLSLSAGMWLFVISSYVFYWFGLFVAMLQVYLIISYTVSIFGRDYDIEGHRNILQEHPIDGVTAPSVDIYLPCCKEPIEVLENTYKHVKELRWPDGKLKVYVLDDGASEAVQSMVSQYGYEYICREDRPRLKKAGNLRWAFARTQGDFFAIFDADFCPRPDFLWEIMPIHMAKPDTAIVQTPQFFRVTDDQTWIEQGAGAVQELFYRVVQINRDRWGAAICVGSNAVYRREALIETGGTAEIGFSEDVHTGFYAVNRGWKVRYLPLCLACGICPDTPRAFFSQQMRWCMGSTTLLTNMDFWRSRLSIIQKICYLSGMMYYSAISLSIFISPLPGILMLWARPEYVRYYNLAFAGPSILYSLIAMRCWAKASFGFNVQHVMVIQSYAYLTAIKDRLFGRALAWVPSGDVKAHKNNKYRNMRILAVCWSVVILGLLISGVVYQVLRSRLHWYDCVPLIGLMTLNLYLSHRFLLWHGKV